MSPFLPPATPAPTDFTKAYKRAEHQRVTIHNLCSALECYLNIPINDAMDQIEDIKEREGKYLNYSKITIEQLADAKMQVDELEKMLEKFNTSIDEIPNGMREIIELSVKPALDAQLKSAKQWEEQLEERFNKQNGT